MTLYEEWQDNKDRPAWVRSNSDRLQEELNLDNFDEVPDWASLNSITSWLEDYQGVVTKQLDSDESEESQEGGES